MRVLFSVRPGVVDRAEQTEHTGDRFRCHQQVGGSCSRAPVFGRRSGANVASGPGHQRRGLAGGTQSLQIPQELSRARHDLRNLFRPRNARRSAAAGTPGQAGPRMHVSSDQRRNRRRRTGWHRLAPHGTPSCSAGGSDGSRRLIPRTAPTIASLPARVARSGPGAIREAASSLSAGAANPEVRRSGSRSVAAGWARCLVARRDRLVLGVRRSL